MRIQRLNAENPEYVDIAVKNVEGATLTLGYPVAFVTGAASGDGVNVVLGGRDPRTFSGISLKDIPDVGTGAVVRAYGLVASTAIFAAGTSVTVAAGAPMGVGAAGSLGVNSTGLLETYGPLVAFDAIGAATNSPGGYARAFARAL